MSNGRLAVPGQINMDVQMHPGPPASPTVIQLQSPAGIQQHVFGGLTKLETAAIAIAAAMCSNLHIPENEYEAKTYSENVLESIPRNAVAMAFHVLTECDKAQTPPRIES